MASRNKSRNRGKRPTATLDLKAKDVSEKDAGPKVDASKVLSRGAGSEATSSQPDPDSGAKPTATSDKSKPAQASDKRERPTTSANAGGKPGSAEASASKSAPASKSDTAPKAASDEKRSGLGSAVTHLLAGGIGGVLAFAGASTLDLGGSQSGTPGTTVGTEAIESRLAALESKEPTTVNAEIPAELSDRISKLESLSKTVATLTEKQGALSSETTELASGMKALADPAGGGATELRQRLDSMESTIASLGKAAEGADGKTIPKLAALAGRMNDMRTELEAKIAAANKAVKADLSSQVAAVDTALKASAEGDAGTSELLETLKGGNQRLSVGLETARTETSRIANDLAALRTSSEETKTAVGSLTTSTEALTERMAGLENKTAESLSSLPGEADIAAAVAPMSGKLTSLETSMEGVLKRESDRAASAKNVLLSIELANLQRAVDQGRPIDTEIKSLQANAPAGMDLSTLNTLASKTVLGHEELIRQFSSVASETIQSADLDEDAGTFDKLMASARSIVRVRKTGDVEGTTTEAVIARAEDNLKRGDLGAAVTELAALDEKATAAMAGWLAKARDRLAVDAALKKIETGLKASVSSSATN